MIHAYSKLAIEVTVITFHPVLYRNLNKIFSSLFIFKKFTKRPNRINIEIINIKSSNASKEQQLHFEMLKNLWK
uniref:Uncharacterized protein n=1 Tax=Meloidogyne hapla TaxID=6305 RepID=A0A1I8B5J4_MELHA